MKLIFLVTAFAITAYAAPTDEWNLYKAEYKKVYTSETENMRRLKEYLKSKEIVEEHNRKYDRGETTYTMGINQFSDWFPEELKETKTKLRLKGLKPRESESGGKPFELPPGAVVPDSINWVEKGAVTSVKYQGHCGSCYAFSAVGALEGLMFIKNHTITDLSAQELVDCDTNSNGCGGGYMQGCFKYVMENGIESDASYPYIAKRQNCSYEREKTVADCTGYIDLENEEDLTKAVGTVGPISIAFASHDNFHRYKSGIYDGPCDSRPNHGMLAVGYGTDEKTKTDYWLIKNSWGTKWGEKGYVRVVRNKDMCYVGDEATYPIYN